jgi:hypothetical protein
VAGGEEMFIGMSGNPFLVGGILAAIIVVVVFIKSRKK